MVNYTNIFFFSQQYKQENFQLLSWLLNWGWPLPALFLSFDEFFENAANKDPGKVEADGSTKSVEDGAVVIFVAAIHDEHEKGSEVACAKSDAVDYHPRN